MADTFTFDQAKASAAKGFSFAEARHIDQPVSLQQLQEQNDPFAESTLPLNAPKAAQLADLHERATNLQQWHDRTVAGLGDDADAQARVAAQYTAQRDKLDADAKERGLNFSIFKGDDEVRQAQLEAAKLSPEEMAAFTGPKVAKVAAPVERRRMRFILPPAASREWRRCYPSRSLPQ
jgi:hypothetical protein